METLRKLKILPHLSEIMPDREEVRPWVWVKSHCDDCGVELRTIEQGYWGGLEHGYPAKGGCSPKHTCTYCVECAEKRKHACDRCGSALSRRALREAYAEVVEQAMADHNLPRDVYFVDPNSVSRQQLLSTLRSKHNLKLNILKQRALEEAGLPTDGPLAPAVASAAANAAASPAGGKPGGKKPKK